MWVESFDSGVSKMPAVFPPNHRENGIKWWYPWDGTLNNQSHTHLIQ